MSIFVHDTSPSGVTTWPALSGLGAFPPGLMAFWSLPLTLFGVWLDGWSAGLPAETDRDEVGEQLPVPNPHQAAKDSELFA